MLYVGRLHEGKPPKSELTPLPPVARDGERLADAHLDGHGLELWLAAGSAVTQRTHTRAAVRRAAVG